VVKDHKERFVVTAAKFLSYLFHPLSMPVIGVVLIFYSDLVPGFSYWSYGDTLTNGWLFILMCYIFTNFIPGVSALILKKMGKISSLQMPKKEERLLPFTITGMSYVFFFYYVKDLIGFEPPLILNLFLLGAIIAIIIGVVITFNWKISVHMIGVGGLVGIFFLMSVWIAPVPIYLISSILISGLIGAARITLKAHTLSQVFAGFLLGFFCESFFVFLI